MGHVWSEYVAPDTTPLRDKPSQFDPHFGFSTPRREKSNVLLIRFSLYVIYINILFRNDCLTSRNGISQSSIRC